MRKWRSACYCRTISRNEAFPSSWVRLLVFLASTQLYRQFPNQAERCRASRRVATGDSRRGYCSAVVDSGVFVNNVFVGFGVALFVINIPAESFEERVEKLAAGLSFVVVAEFVGVAVAVKTINEVEDLLRDRRIFICARHGCLVPEKPAVSNPELRPDPQHDRRDLTHGKSPLYRWKKRRQRECAAPFPAPVIVSVA